MERISEKQLQNLVSYLNTVTSSPQEYCGNNGINIGHFSISHAYGGVCLYRTVNDGGGITCPLMGGHVSKRELFNEMHAFIKGIDFQKRYEQKKEVQ
jgi:hypothetical protein